MKKFVSVSKFHTPSSLKTSKFMWAIVYEFVDVLGINNSPLRICYSLMPNLLIWVIHTLKMKLPRVSYVEQDLHLLPEHLRSPQVYCGVRMFESFIFYVWFVNCYLFFGVFYMLWRSTDEFEYRYISPHILNAAFTRCIVWWF